uniref:Peptidase_M1 domain-containing protein n=1 Tax=Syphacia muris TaxID=451379 RepID=A0A0N5ATR8_9BILA
MENWGLITAVENSVAYSKYLSDARTKLWVTDVVAHEIAHMWFGNLATMRWWNDMWINEGFATMMAVKAADYVQNTNIREVCFTSLLVQYFKILLYVISITYFK